MMSQGADEVWKLSSRLPRFGHLYSISVEYSGGEAKSKGSRKLDKYAPLDWSVQHVTHTHTHTHAHTHTHTHTHTQTQNCHCMV